MKLMGQMRHVYEVWPGPWSEETTCKTQAWMGQ